MADNKLEYNDSIYGGYWAKMDEKKWIIKSKILSLINYFN